MFRKENGVTLVALVITIIVLLILAGVTISMVLGDDGIVKQAGEARTAQNIAAVSDQAAVAYATVRAEQIARNAGVDAGTKITKSNFVNAVAYEMELSDAFDAVKVSGSSIYVELNGTAGVEVYSITLDATNDVATMDATNIVKTELEAATGAAPASY